MNHSILSTRNRAEPGSSMPRRLKWMVGGCLSLAAPHWRRWLRQPVGRGYWRRWRNILTVLYAALAVAGLRNYITVVSTPGIVGVLALLYTPVFEKNAPGRLRFAWPALFFITLFFLVPVSTTLYCAWACGACCFLESFHRRVERTVPFVLLLLTPIMGYFVTILSFPIRLQLTRLAGRLIGLAGLPTAVSGNVITIRDHAIFAGGNAIHDNALSAGGDAIRNHAFSVDPACIGLHMYVVSLLTALLLMNYWQTHHRRRLGFGPMVALLCVTTGLNVLANLLRIICLVILNILPSNPLHNILGVVFLLVYILLPLLPVVRWTIRRFGRPVAVASPTRTLRTHWQLLANLIMAGAVTGLVVLSFGIREPHAAAALTLRSRDTIPGYTIKEVNNSILQLDNGRSLVYIKPIPGFYYTDHTPTICWQGSGYQFTELTDTVVDETRVFKGVLELQSRPSSADGPTSGAIQGKHQLYTAWWYDNGVRQTTAPVDWRWDWIHGAPPYSVVNLTAATPEQLAAELHYVLTIRPFHSLLGRTVPRARVKIW